MPLTGQYLPGTSDWSRNTVDRYEATAGAEGGTLHGRPVVILTTVGARTGGLRKTPLMRVEHEGTYAVVASLGGAAHHPKWYYNLVANPHVELQDLAVKRDYRAREATGDDRVLWWERAVAAFPDYASYQQKTSRVIPVFVVEPMESAAG